MAARKPKPPWERINPNLWTRGDDIVFRAVRDDGFLAWHAAHGKKQLGTANTVDEAKALCD